MATDPHCLVRLTVTIAILSGGLLQGQEAGVQPLSGESPTAQVLTWSDGTMPRSIVTSRRSRLAPRSGAAVVPARYTTVTPQLSVPRYGHCSSCRCGRNHALPLGTAVNFYLDAHITSGRRGQLILYHYDFEHPTGDNSARLNRYGKVKLQRFLPWLESTGGPLIVEHVPGQQRLSEARRAHVLETVQTRLGVSLDAGQVIVGIPRVPGMRGVEAAEIDRNQLQTTRSQGAVSSGFQAGLTNNISTGSANRR